MADSLIDFEKEMSDFIVNSNEVDPITSIYNLFPNLSDEQVKVFLQIQFMAIKHNLQPILNFLDTFMKYKRTNKNMTFANMVSFRKTLESYSLTEHLKGVKVSSQNSISEER